MGNILKRLFGKKEQPDFKELVRQGALLLDVRTKEEYESGHIKGAKNVPVADLGYASDKFKKDRAVITCCRSGARSKMAQGLLRKKGFQKVYNGGAWTKLKNKIA